MQDIKRFFTFVIFDAVINKNCNAVTIMGTQRILIVCGGPIGMLILMLLRRKSIPQVQLWKMPVISVLLTIAGVSGASAACPYPQDPL